MPLDLKNIELLFSGPPDDVLGEYIRTIANGGLGRYRRIIQYGNKEGQPLYAHVVDLVFTFARLSELINLGETEQRVMMLALSAHDINKVADEKHNHLRFADLASPETIGRELEQLGADDFFPAWRSYLPDIVALIRAHSDHFHHSGELLFARNVQAQKYALGDQVPRLAHLIKGLDALDLSHSLEERQHKATFLSHFNAYSTTQYEFVYHVIGEQRGILTNAIHNRVAEYLWRNLKLLPLLYYPEGVAYLAQRGSLYVVDEGAQDAMAQAVANFLENQTRGRFESFIKAGNQGIKIDQKCLELGISFEQLWQRVDAIIQGKNYSTLASMEESARKRTKTKLEGDVSSEADWWRSKLSDQYLLPTERETLRLGELIRSYYIFLAKHFKREYKDPWAYLYELLQVDEPTRKKYAYLDPNYDRPYVVAADLLLNYMDLYSMLLAEGATLLGDQALESPWRGVFQQYIREQVRFSFQSLADTAFGEFLRRYVVNNHRQSAFGSSSFAADLWRAGDVTKTIKVQQFSNRLAAGPGDPVKNVDPITRAQFLLEKLNYVPAYEATTYYLQIYPYAFFPEAYLRMWRDTVSELAAQDVSALFLKSDEILRSIFEDRGQIKLHAAGTKSNGLPLPGAGEVFGNLLIWPLNAPGANDTECFWYAFTCAFAMQRFVGGRVVLTRSPVPILSAEEAQAFDLYTDQIPAAFTNLLQQNGYAYMELARLQTQLAAIYAVQREVGGTSDELLPLLRSTGDGPLGIYFAAERLLTKQIRSNKKAKAPEWLAIHASGRIAESLRLIAKEQGGELMNDVIQRLAQLAWEGNLKGPSLEKNSLMMPLNHCFEKLAQWQEPIDKEMLRAATIMDIYSYLERIREQGMVGTTTMQKTRAFVEVFFNEMLGRVYKNNLARLLADEKLIRSAFLFHIREQVAKASEAKKSQ
jgi:CRISPR-associated protein Csc3